MKKIATTLALTLTLGLSLAACTGNTDNNSTATNGASNPAASSTATGTKTITTQKASDGKTVASNPGKGIISSTKMTSCTTTEGDVKAQGTVTPPADSPGEVQITVSWVNPKTSQVIAKGIQKYDNPVAGQKLDWTISAKLPKTETPTSCVLGATIIPAG